MEEKYLTVTEAAAKLKITATTVYAMIKNGKINFKELDKGNRTVKRIPESELKKFRI
jgi:excisionase family DNA binding protein